ncbi:hypothetical protein V2J09_020199 [Rumex salicifolius]
MFITDPGPESNEFSVRRPILELDTSGVDLGNRASTFERRRKKEKMTNGWKSVAMVFGSDRAKQKPGRKSLYIVSGDIRNRLRPQDLRVRFRRMEWIG